MKIGVLLNNFGGFPETGRGALACLDLARHVERLGFDSVYTAEAWGSDAFQSPVPMLPSPTPNIPLGSSR